MGWGLCGWVGGGVPLIIALHVSRGEIAQELTRSTSLSVEIGSVILHFGNVPPLISSESLAALLSPPASSSSSSSLCASIDSLHSAALIFHASVLWCDSHVSKWL